MGTPPPPFQYGQGSPGAPLYDRHTLKAQRRAAAEQARLQRTQMRLQMRAARRNSVVGPLLLVGLGVALLLLQTGHWRWQNALTWFAHWWPSILIVAGVLLLGEWAWDRQHPTSSAGLMPGRRTLGGGAATLLVLLALAGIAVRLAERGSDWVRLNVGGNQNLLDFNNWPQIFANRTEYTETLHIPLAADGTLTIDNPRGDVAVTGDSQDGQIHVSVHQHLYSWHMDETDARRRQEQPHLAGDRQRATLTTTLQDRDDADLAIQLPHDASLIVRSNHGDVSVAELRGTADITARDGDVKLTAIRGPVHLTAADDNAEVTAHSLAGGLTVEGHTGDITLTDLDGPLLLQGDFFGTTHLERIRGSVHFKSSFTDFACSSLPGELNIEGRSDLQAQRLEGPVLLTTTNRNVTLDSLRGAANITDRNGSVSLTLAGPLQPIQVGNRDGSVELSIPVNQGFSLASSTHNGDIHNDFGLASSKRGEVAQLDAKVDGGGPLLQIDTSEGDISLQRSSASTSSDWNDSPKRLTEAPSSSPLKLRHSGSTKAP